MNAEQVLTTAGKLVECLRSFDDQDRASGLQAAEIIERTLETFRLQPERTVSRLRYDIGPKGMLDWYWSQDHRAELERLSQGLFLLLSVAPDAGGR